MSPFVFRLVSLFDRVLRSYFLTGLIALWCWEGMIVSLAGAPTSTLSVFLGPLNGACFGYNVSRIVSKYRKEKAYEHRSASPDDIRGTDLGPPYITRTRGVGAHTIKAIESLARAGLGPEASRCSCSVCSTERTEQRAGEGPGLVPDSVTPLVGYRNWRVRSDLRLGSRVVADHFWTKGLNVAGCDLERRSHLVAQVDCLCGFYAYNSRWRMESEDLPIGGIDGIVWGQVELFGVVTEHEQGYRASHARITGIYDTGKLSKQVAKLYEVELLSVPIRKG